MKFSTLFLLLLTLFIPASLKGQEGAWEVPIDSRTQEGNSSTLYPFTFGYTRYQQVNAATDFGSSLGGSVIGPEGVFLRGMFVRLDSPNGFSFAGYATNLQVNLSTTARQPDSLSPVFSENVGANDQVVFGLNAAIGGGSYRQFAGILDSRGVNPVYPAIFVSSNGWQLASRHSHFRRQHRRLTNGCVGSPGRFRFQCLCWGW